MQCYLKKAEIPEDTATLGKKKKKKCFVAVTRPSLLKSTDPKLFFARIYKKL